MWSVGRLPTLPSPAPLTVARRHAASGVSVAWLVRESGTVLADRHARSWPRRDVPATGPTAPGSRRPIRNLVAPTQPRLWVLMAVGLPLWLLTVLRPRLRVVRVLRPRLQVVLRPMGTRP